MRSKHAGVSRSALAPSSLGTSLGKRACLVIRWSSLPFATCR